MCEKVQSIDISEKNSPDRPLRWLDHLSTYKRILGPALTLLLFSFGLLACWHLLRELDPQDLGTAVSEIPNVNLLAAVGATALGFIALLGYEWSGCRFTGVRLPLPVMAMGSFCANAIGNAIGLSALTGGSVRYRLYSPYQVSTGNVARISLFVSLSLGCALPVLAAMAALISPNAAAIALHSSPAVVQSVAAAVLVLTVAVIYALSRNKEEQTPESDCAKEEQTPESDCATIRLGKFRLRLPGLKLSGMQLLITLVDVCAAAFVLYVLLPEAPPLPVFFLVYLLALAAGVLSHVPGGLGVFEAVLLAAFAGQLSAAPLAAALLIYRLIYVGLPLAIACTLLLAYEARRLLPAGRKAVRATSGLAAPVLSLLVFFAGMVLIFSGATPAIDERLKSLSFLVPQCLIDFSHLAVSLIGMLCLLLAHGLYRRLSAACALTVLLLVNGATLSILRGFDWEEACIMLLTAGLLVLFRQSFYRPSRLLEMPFSRLNLAACLCVLSASLWLMMFVYQNEPYSHKLFWQFGLDEDAPRTLRAELGSGLLLAGIALLWLLRPTPIRIQPASPEELSKAAHIVATSNQPDGGLALTGDKTLLFHPDGDAFLMFARHGRSLVNLFDPIGANSRRAELIWQFRDVCDTHHLRPVFYQVRAENLPFYMDIGLTAVKLGEEARVDLHRFDLQNKGKAMKELRYTLNRGQRDGLQVKIHEPGEAPLVELQSISEAWMKGKHAREKGFSLGRFAPEYLKHFRIAVIYAEEQAVAFANLLETNRQDLASLDLMRVRPDAPKLTMEFLILNLLLHFKNSGHKQFSLGMVPLAGLQPRRGAPLTQRVGSLIFQRSEQFYNFKGLRRFKDKFQPEWEPRYMAVPAGLDPLVALADTAALIAGGYTGLIKR